LSHIIDKSNKNATYEDWEQAGATWWIEGLWKFMDKIKLKKGYKKDLIYKF
jgi:hypothetical protein